MSVHGFILLFLYVTQSLCLCLNGVSNLKYMQDSSNPSFSKQKRNSRKFSARTQQKINPGYLANFVWRSLCLLIYFGYVWYIYAISFIFSFFFLALCFTGNVQINLGKLKHGHNKSQKRPLNIHRALLISVHIFYLEHAQSINQL